MVGGSFTDFAEATMIVQVLGPGCENCKKLLALAEQAVRELALDAKVEKVTDLGAIVGFGVMRTPALAVDGAVKVQGRIPGLEEIKGLLERG
jgi:small redox-active disulfide protein 2